MPDYTARRIMMVDTQVRPSDVTKFPIIDAMLDVPREEFVPTAQSEAAYVGENLDIGAGRTLLDPRTLAKMLDVLAIGNDELVLDLGCGLGYSSAVIARIAEAVVAVEADEAMAAEASEILMNTGADNVAVHCGALVDGSAKHGPYDVIVVEGGVGEVPASLSDQLKDGGRIAAIFMDGALGEVRVGLKRGQDVSWRMAFNATAPVLSGFEQKAEFQL